MKIRMIKKILILIIVLVLMINFISVAAIVSDNDGSAFVTKAEFEALKSSFSKQVDDYENSITNKIDGAIASYLAGIKTSKTETVSFPLTSGKKIVIGNSDHITNLKFGKAKINFKITNMQINARLNSATFTDGYNCATGTLTMTRDTSSTIPATKEYEIFQINKTSGKFERYLYDGLLDLDVVGTHIFNAGLAGVSIPSTITLAWHAGAWTKSIFDRDYDHDKSAGNGSSAPRHDDRLNNLFLYTFYGRQLNFGIGFWNAINNTDRFRYKNVVSSVSLTSDNEVQFFIDDTLGTTNRNIWVVDPSVDNSVVCASTQSPYVSTNQSYTTPATAGLTTKLTLIDRRMYKDGTAYKGSTAFVQNKAVTWITTGTFDGTGATTTADPWYEFHFEPANKSGGGYKGSSIANSNISSSVLSEYSTSSNPYHGYLTEGLPIGSFSSEDSLTFKLDTSSLGAKCNFAISTKPFDTADLTTTAASTDIKLTVNGSECSTCVKELDAGTNKIKIDITDAANSDGTTFVFFKMAYDRTDTTNNYKRGIITWPESYTYTAASSTK